MSTATSVIANPNPVTGTDSATLDNLITLITSGAAIPFNMSDEQRIALERTGLVFGEPVEDDYTLIHVDLSPGWRVVANQCEDHTHFDMLDVDGRRRAIIGYEPARGREYVFTHVLRRFTIQKQSEAIGEHIAYVVRDAVTGGTIHTATEWTPVTGYIGACESALHEAILWLEKDYPDFRDFAAYWDD